MVPTSLEGEPTAQERGPLGGCLLMLASQYAVFVSPLWGPLVGKAGPTLFFEMPTQIRA